MCAGEFRSLAGADEDVEAGVDGEDGTFEAGPVLPNLRCSARSRGDKLALAFSAGYCVARSLDSGARGASPAGVKWNEVVATGGDVGAVGDLSFLASARSS